MNGERFVISICGPSGAGKSQLAKAVVAALGDDVCGRVAGDNYLVPASEPLDVFLTKPLQYDWELIATQLCDPIGSERTVPDFDFERMTRLTDHGRMPFTVRRVMVIDAMYPCPMADLRVLLAVPTEVRRERIIERDERWQSRVIDRWEHLEIARRQLEAAEHTYDLTLDGRQPLHDNATLIARHVPAR